MQTQDRGARQISGELGCRSGPIESSISPSFPDGNRAHGFEVRMAAGPPASPECAVRAKSSSDSRGARWSIPEMRQGKWSGEGPIDFHPARLPWRTNIPAAAIYLYLAIMKLCIHSRWGDI